MVSLAYHPPKNTSNPLALFFATMATFAALAANLRHVLTVLAYLFAAFTTGFASFLRGEFMSCTLLMGGLPPLTGDRLLFFRIHGSKSTFISRHTITLLFAFC